MCILLPINFYKKYILWVLSQYFSKVENEAKSWSLEPVSKSTPVPITFNFTPRSFLSLKACAELSHYADDSLLYQPGILLLVIFIYIVISCHNKNLGLGLMYLFFHKHTLYFIHWKWEIEGYNFIFFNPLPLILVIYLVHTHIVYIGFLQRRMCLLSYLLTLMAWCSKTLSLILYLRHLNLQ